MLNAVVANNDIYNAWRDKLRKICPLEVSRVEFNAITPQKIEDLSA